MLAPSPETIVSKRGPGIKEFGPSARFIHWPYSKQGATLRLYLHIHTYTYHYVYTRVHVTIFVFVFE